MAVKQIVVSLLIFGLFLPTQVLSHQPVLEPVGNNQSEDQPLYFQATKLADPTISSQAVYGLLNNPGQEDVYVFVPEKTETVPVEILVPIRPGNQNFFPELFIAAKNIPQARAIENPAIQQTLPEGYKVMKISNLHQDGNFYEEFSFERYWKSEQYQLELTADQNYFLIVKEPNKQTGDYTLGIGSAENFDNVNFLGLLQNVFMLKLGLIGDQQVPWVDMLGMFLMLAGLIVGLGAVTVIDTLGLFGRRSEYWTETTIRAHKVTKPLIWLGLGILIGGLAILYRESWLTGVAFFQAILIGILILNGLFLSFYISPRLLQREKDGEIAKILPDTIQSKILISFIVSFLGWWTLVFLACWYILVRS